MATKTTTPKKTPTTTTAPGQAAKPVRYLSNPRVPAPVQVDNPEHERHGQAGHIEAVNKGDGLAADEWSCTVRFDQDDTSEDVAVTDLVAIR